LKIRGGWRLLRGIDARVDLVKRLALMDDRAFLEHALQDHARDLWTDVGGLESGDPARKLLLDRCTALLHDDIADSGGAALASAATWPTSLRVAAPACRQQQKRRKGGADAATGRT
jgi:hypothetical protein